jgi:hypothetical protein
VDTAISFDPVGTDFTWEEAMKIYERYDFEKCTLLLTFVEMVIFHSLVILLASKRPIERHDIKIYEDELANFIRTEHLQADFEVNDPEAEVRELERRRCLNLMKVKLHLPPFYALDLLFKYQMYDRACDLLFYVGSWRQNHNDYEDLLNIIRWEYEHEKKACDKYRADVMKNKSGAESNLKA